MSTVNLGGEKAVITKNKPPVKKYKVLSSPNENKIENTEKKWLGIPVMLWTWGIVLIFIAIAVLIIIECHLLSTSSSDSTNFVLIVLDDLGWRDISSHGSKVPTPNIDALIEDGIEFTNFHAGVICTPGRAALLTGRFAFRLGMQNEVALNDYMRVHIPSDEFTFAEHLLPRGYDNHYIGKWHCGFASWEYTPLYRGWMSFVGYFLGEIDYFTHEFFRDGHDSYLDFWNKNEPLWEANNTWTDDVFFEYLEEAVIPQKRPFTVTWATQTPHSPDNESPENIPEIEQTCTNSLTHDSEAYDGRFSYCKRLSHLDKMIGVLVEKLKTNNLWDTTIVMLTSDNGGAMFNSYSYTPYIGMGNNFPYRGGKGSYFEGGLRVPMVISGGHLDDSYRNMKDDRLAHIVDISATIMDLAGVAIPDNFDGISLLGTATRSVLIHNLRPTNESSMKQEHVSFFVFPIANQSNVVQYNNYKYIHGSQYVDSWVDVDADPLLIIDGTLPDEQPCYPTPCLFDLSTDPYEKEDIFDTHPDVVKEIEDLIANVISSDDFHSGQDYNEIAVDWDEGYIRPYL